MAEKKSEKRKIYYMKAKGIEDVARLACSFDMSPTTLFYTKSNDQYQVLKFGESIDETIIAYYCDTKSIAALAKYSLSYDKKDEVTFVKEAGGSAAEAYYMNMVGIDISGMEPVKKIKEESIFKIKVESVEDLVKLIISKSVSDEKLCHLYVFSFDKKWYIGAFDIVDELTNDKKIFYYAVSENEINESFARYNYTSNELSFSDSAGEHTYMYVKLIHLAEPFSFL